MNVKNAADETPLTIAASRGHMDGVKVLLANSADVFVEDKDGHNAFWRVQCNGHLGVAIYLRNISTTWRAESPNTVGQNVAKNYTGRKPSLSPESCQTHQGKQAKRIMKNKGTSNHSAIFQELYLTFFYNPVHVVNPPLNADGQ